MKIKVIEKDYDYVAALPAAKHKQPKKPSILFRFLMKTASKKDLKDASVSYTEHGMENLGKNVPCLILMNHSSFIDLEIAADYFYPRPLSIVGTSDGFVGKEWFMRRLGCIPTKKFIHEATLVYDLMYAIKKLGCSALMYPEAGYTFDGTATTLPDSLGKLVKLLKVPVVTVITHGAFIRDPLYNGLQKRKVAVGVDINYFLTPTQIAKTSVADINEALKKAFAFDNFEYQFEHKITVSEPFRADGLNRVLYKCPHCKAEGKMKGEGLMITCGNCGAQYKLTEFGKLQAQNVEPIFEHIPDWYKWEREEVKNEIISGDYKLDVPVDIYILKDYKAIYKVGTGNLYHDRYGFKLNGCDGKLNFSCGPKTSYSLNADYFWYEIGDMISIGSEDCLYYCFPKNGVDVVAKTRLATEEIYKLALAEERNVQGK